MGCHKDFGRLFSLSHFLECPPPLTFLFVSSTDDLSDQARDGSRDGVRLMAYSCECMNICRRSRGRAGPRDRYFAGPQMLETLNIKATDPQPRGVLSRRHFLATAALVG